MKRLIAGPHPMTISYAANVSSSHRAHRMGSPDLEPAGGCSLPALHQQGDGVEIGEDQASRPAGPGPSRTRGRHKQDGTNHKHWPGAHASLFSIGHDPRTMVAPRL